jgi:chemotaxis-related protein WspB
MQALRFRIGDRTLAIDLRWIREVCPIVRLRPLPQAPAWLPGLFDYHGSLLPAVDGGIALGGEPVPAAIGARILLLHGAMDDRPEAPRATFGLLVDRVDGVATLDRDGGSWTARDGLPGLPFLREVVNQAGASVHLLDAARLASMHASLLEGPGMLAPAGIAAP